MNKLLLVLLLALAPTAFANIWYVDGVQGNDMNSCKTRQTACKTIGHAISLASSGDTIGVGSGTYSESLTINTSLKIFGTDARTTVVDGSSQFRTVFNISTGVVLLSRLTIQNGSANGSYAGGIENDQAATLTISYCTIRQNTGGYGGGIANFGTATINDSTITGNGYSGGYAGGIANFSRATVINTTITENTGGYGGGIVNFDTTTVHSSTITGNIGYDYLGGIVNLAGPGSVHAVSLENTVVANKPGGNCYLTVTSEGYNLSDDGSCNFNGPGDLNNTDPMLGPLGNNGGPTQTLKLLRGSPAIDAGNPNGCTDGSGNPLTTDQRGWPRPGKYDPDKRCDIGAYERQID